MGGRKKHSPAKSPPPRTARQLQPSPAPEREAMASQQQASRSRLSVQTIPLEFATFDGDRANWSAAVIDIGMQAQTFSLRYVILQATHADDDDIYKAQDQFQNKYPNDDLHAGQMVFGKALWKACRDGQAAAQLQKCVPPRLGDEWSATVGSDMLILLFEEYDKDHLVTRLQTFIDMMEAAGAPIERIPVSQWVAGIEQAVRRMIRHKPLTVEEMAVATMLQTLRQDPAYKNVANTFEESVVALGKDEYELSDLIQKVKNHALNNPGDQLQIRGPHTVRVLTNQVEFYDSTTQDQERYEQNLLAYAATARPVPQGARTGEGFHGITDMDLRRGCPKCGSEPICQRGQCVAARVLCGYCKKTGHLVNKCFAWLSDLQAGKCDLMGRRVKVNPIANALHALPSVQQAAGVPQSLYSPPYWPMQPVMAHQAMVGPGFYGYPYPGEEQFGRLQLVGEDETPSPESSIGPKENCKVVQTGTQSR